MPEQVGDTITRPWGSYTILVDKPTHKVKSITVKAGQRLSLQRHKYRNECWTIVSGEPIVSNGKQIGQAGPGLMIAIEVGAIHRIQAQGEDVIFIEVQLGTYFGEDDIERLEDDYGRDS